MGQEATLLSWLGCDSAPCLGLGLPGCSASKTLHLKICTLPSSPAGVYPSPGCAEKQSCWLGWDCSFVPTGKNLLCQGPWVGCCGPLPLYYHGTPRGWASHIPCGVRSRNRSHGGDLPGAVLRERQRAQCVAPSLALLVQSV